MTYPQPTTAYCASCKTVVPAEVVERNASLFLNTACPICGNRQALIEEDAALYRTWEQNRRPNRAPEQRQTDPALGCPFDCGLCPNHLQKSCITLLEVTTACDLGCPVCYAQAGAVQHRSLHELTAMLDAAVTAANGKPDILQISGGEPTSHPEILSILHAARERPFRYVMLNTNGLSIGSGALPVEKLAALCPGFEVYLQFDALNDTTYQTLRGRSLLAEKRAALDLMAQHGIPVTLVATLRKNLNMDQVGELVRFGIEHPAVRGINFQCEAFFGRHPHAAQPLERVTQTAVVRALEQQSNGLLSAGDFLPLSCGLACMAYLEHRDTWHAISPALARVLQTNPLTTSIEDISQLAQSVCACQSSSILTDLVKALPSNLFQLSVRERSQLVHDRYFHVTVISFLDEQIFDLNRARRECTHILQPDGRKIPFSAYNVIHRTAAAEVL